MISLPLILITIIFSSLLTSCAEPRPLNDVAASDRAAETETLLASAERGTAEDQYNLGMRYERGITITQSYLEAVHWYRLAAMQGYREGQYKICEMSERGQGLPQDYQEAARWYLKAAKQGHDGAQNNLGKLYETASVR